MNLRPAALLACIPFAFAPAAAAAAALDTAPWEMRQAFEMPTTGAAKITLPADALDAARPDLGDLRLLDPAGGEVPFAILHAEPPIQGRQVPQPLSARLLDSSTVLEIDLAEPQPVSRVLLETPEQSFVKGATVDVADTGRRWRRLASDLLIFRHASGAAQLSLDLDNRPVSSIRITIDDSKSGPVPFSRAVLVIGERPAPPPESEPIEILSAESGVGETRLILDLGARNRPVVGIVLNPEDEIFSRRVSLISRSVSDAEAFESARDVGTINRLRFGGGRRFEELRLPLAAPIADARIELSIDNGDSPPLAIKEASVLLRPIHLAFLAKTAGRYILLSGHPSAPTPRYDVAAFADDWRRLPAISPRWNRPERNPGFRPPQPPVEVPELAGAFSPKEWPHQRAVAIHQAGAQILDLDPAALVGARPDLADIRLARGDRQIPYLLERTRLSRSLPLPLSVAPDSKRPQAGRWRLKLPAAGIPISRLTFTVDEPLFERDVVVYEMAEDGRGQGWQRRLGSARWFRRSAAESPRQSIPLQSPPATAELFLEIDHGDNAAFAPAAAEAIYPVIRLRFRASETGEATLAYGNPRASAPRYDIQLAARRLLAARANVATLAASNGDVSSRRTPFTLTGRAARTLFWASLGLAVVILLWAVARLLPKPPDTPNEP